MSDRVDAAREAMSDSALELTGRDMGTIHATQIVRETLAAAATDRDAGIVRVNTRDKATLDRVARALWDEAMSDETPEWRDMAWADMGGSEPSWERAKYELLADAALAALGGES